MHVQFIFVLLFLPYAFCKTSTPKASGPLSSAAGQFMKPAATRTAKAIGPAFPVAVQHLKSAGAVTKAAEASASQSSTAVQHLKTAAAMTATAGFMHMYHRERSKAAVLETKASCRTTCDVDLAMRDEQLQLLRRRIAGLEKNPDKAALAIAQRDVDLLKEEKRRLSWQLATLQTRNMRLATNARRWEEQVRAAEVTAAQRMMPFLEDNRKFQNYMMRLLEDGNENDDAK